MKAIFLKSGVNVVLDNHQKFEPTPKMLQIVETVNNLSRIVRRFRASSVIHTSKDGTTYEPYMHGELSQYGGI